MVDKRLLLIGNEKSFMTNAIATGLEKEDFTIIRAGLSKQAVEEIDNRPGIYIMYLGDVTDEDADLLKYINEKIDTERFHLYIVGNHEELDLAAEYIPKEKIQEEYLRPIDVGMLAEDLKSAAEGISIDDSQRKKILIVDDDGTMLRMIRTWLSVRYRVYMANSGKIALSFLKENKVDLVLLDYAMPMVSGPEVLKQMRADKETKDIPVMMLTAKDNKENVVEVANYKPEKYLLKSMPKSQLLGNIREFFEKQDNA